MKALVIGATGATGKELVKLLLGDAYFSEVHVFVRRAMDVLHPKLHVHVIDFNRAETWQSLVVGDVLFSCLGTTLRDAQTKENQWRVDYDYQYAFAQQARNNGVGNYVLVSAQMADARSRFFYTRMKGQLDEAVIRLGFPKTSILRPGVLVRENSDRFTEKLSVHLIQCLNGLGLFRSRRPLPTAALAQAMINASKTPQQGVAILHAADIQNSIKA